MREMCVKASHYCFSQRLEERLVSSFIAAHCLTIQLDPTHPIPSGLIMSTSYAQTNKEIEQCGAQSKSPPQNPAKSNIIRLNQKSHRKLSSVSSPSPKTQFTDKSHSPSHASRPSQSSPSNTHHSDYEYTAYSSDPVHHKHTPPGTHYYTHSHDHYTHSHTYPSYNCPNTP